MATSDRSAYPRVPLKVSLQELAQQHTPSLEKSQWAQAMSREHRLRHTAFVLLKCFQQLHYFPELDHIPAGHGARSNENLCRECGDTLQTGKPPHRVRAAPSRSSDTGTSWCAHHITIRHPTIPDSRVRRSGVRSFIAFPFVRVIGRHQWI